MTYFALEALFTIALCLVLGLNLAFAYVRSLDLKRRAKEDEPIRGTFLRLAVDLALAALMLHALIERAVWQ